MRITHSSDKIPARRVAPQHAQRVDITVMTYRNATETVAANVRAELARRRMSGLKLADEIGMNRSVMQRRLAGEVPFDVDELLRVAAALHVSTDVLMAASLAGGAA